MMKRLGFFFLFWCVLGSAISPELLAQTADLPVDAPPDATMPAAPQFQADLAGPPMNYLFIHDTSVNMRKRRRIAIMQTSIRSVVSQAQPSSNVALRMFGHRFPIEGPDICEDTELIIPPGPVLSMSEDFDLQLNLYADPVIGGGAPVGLALQQSLEDVRGLAGRKEVYLYLVDLIKCEAPNPIEVLRSACEVQNLHLTVIGFGLKSDLQILADAGIPQLGCVDVVNLVTTEEAEAFPDQLLTRLSVEFRNADGELVDPRPSSPLKFTLARLANNNDSRIIRTKERAPNMNSSSIETVGLDAGDYLLNLSYQGQKLRANQPITLTSRATTREVIQLGRLLVDVTDSQGAVLQDPAAREVQIVVLDGKEPIRAIEQTAQAIFDLLPGKRYTVEVSYVVGGKRLSTRYAETVTIAEGNHQQVRIALPIGSMTGNIVDMTGAPAPQVDVQLTAPDDPKQVKQTALTDAEGVYLFADLEAGEYAVHFQKPGYAIEPAHVRVIGGQMTYVDERPLFHGIDISVRGVSGIPIQDADVRITDQATSVAYPVVAYQQRYRNANYLPAGEYVLTIAKSGYQSASQKIVLTDADLALAVDLALPYYVTVEGAVINGKEEPIADAVLEFGNQHSAFLPDQTLRDNPPGVVRVTPGGQVVTQADGSFRATLLVKEPGVERVSIVWQNVYSQGYQHALDFPLPDTPQPIALPQVRLPINFLQIEVRDIVGNALAADSILLYHQQSGQSGIAIPEVDSGVYESVALLDGDYVARVIKTGYQDVELRFSLNGGRFETAPVILYNYVTVSGTVVDGKQNRVVGATISFSENHSQLTSPPPIITGKDGRFQATVLVTSVAAETIGVSWNRADDAQRYQIEAEFRLPSQPKTEGDPLVLGEYELPINFITLEVHDVAARGLGGAQVVFLAEQGQEFPAIERGGGVYESPDLPDGRYSILINKAGYKENTVVPDVTVGPGTRAEMVGPIIIPHYITVTGRMLNGKEDGVANVDVTFAGAHSEQLGQCITDTQGQFRTTLLVTGVGDETWSAVWQEQIYSASGAFTLPGHPEHAVNIGDIHLPINFFAVPVEDVYHRPLTGVTVKMTLPDGNPVQGSEFFLENPEAGVYEAHYIPDGIYHVSLEKDGYETGKSVEISVTGGVQVVLEPVTLGHYVRVEGYALNGKKEPVAGANITVGGHAAAMLLEAEPETPLAADANANPPGAPSPDLAQVAATPVVVTNEAGAFAMQVLVQLPQPDQLVVAWDQRYSASFQIEFRENPGIQRFDLPLPINFLQIQVRDVTGQPLSEAALTFTHQADKTLFAAVEREPGTYECLDGLPDGTYVMQIKKPHYEERLDTFQVHGGEVKQADYQIRHYVSVRGHVTDGKGQDLAAAIIRFNGLKSQAPEKTVSGPDGIFETELLVHEIGQETGTISWAGSHGVYSAEFSIDLSAVPTVLTLPDRASLLPINFISLEVKSVAATGIADASVTFTHRETGQVIAARDRDNGNYEGEELPNGVYDIAIAKENYQDITIENIAVKGGEHQIGIPVPKFQHYITISGMVLNGRQEGVGQAMVQVLAPRRVQECDPVVTREDGSFTLQALVTDVGVEPLDIIWNERYAATIPVQLPTFPEHLQLPAATLPINFILANVRDVYGKPISGVAITFLKQDRSLAAPANPAWVEFSGQEDVEGRYESPELPDGEYLLILNKAGYQQQTYAPVTLRGGQMVSDLVVTLPHVVTVFGNIQDGKQQGIRGAEILFDTTNSAHGSDRLTTDAAGNFREELLVTGTGQEALTVMVSGPPYTRFADEVFTVTLAVDLQTTPGEQDLRNIVMPINYIPIRVHDVSKQPIPDADVTLTWMAPTDGETPIEGAVPIGHATSDGASAQTRPDLRFPQDLVRNLGDGQYEGAYLKDGRYVVTASKIGYESQTRILNVSGGEVASEIVFALSHYVIVSGIVTNGKGDGVPDAVLEFDAQNSSLIDQSARNALPRNPEALPELQATSQARTQVSTDARGYFSATLLVKKAGVQRVRVVWQERYVKQLSFQLPKDNQHYMLENEIRLPINFVPVHVTNVLGEGLAGVEVVLEKSGAAENEHFSLHSLGDGHYETGEIPDGVYTMTISKAGYQDMLETISVQGGEHAPEQQFALAHAVTVRGVIVNGKGGGVSGAKISLTGLSSQFVDSNTQVQTQPDGSFELALLVTATAQPELPEHIEISWKDQTQPFGLAYDFRLPASPGSHNLGILTLPANFASIAVSDFSGQGLTDVTVTFIDEKGKTFPAQEVMNGLYEGQNLPDGVYTIHAAKPGYQETSQANIAIGKDHEIVATQFQLPYYVSVQGVAVDGKGQTLTTAVEIQLEDVVSRLVPESVTVRPDGQFSAQVLVNTPGKEYLRVSHLGEYGLHARRVAFVLPPQPGTVDLQRITLPMNVVPVEVKDLLGYGIEGAAVILKHVESGKEIPAIDKGNGSYEGQQLLDGVYSLLISKDGYTSSESPTFFVSDGVVTETKSIRLNHYVRLTGMVTTGEGGGVRDPLLTVTGLRSQATHISSGSDGTFDVEVEVREIGNEQLLVNWKNAYAKPVIFKLPAAPGRKNLGEIRLPINFLSMVITDISGSPIPDVAVTVADAANNPVQTLRTDQNGTCKTHDVPNGAYSIAVNKPGYAEATRDVYVSDGVVRVVRVTLPHYLIVRGQVKDITGKPVDNVAVIFDEFADKEGQKLRTVTQPGTGQFEQQLLIDDARFLERQRGHFQIKKGEIEQTFTFKISTQPNLMSAYTTLLFPSRYLLGKVVDAEVQSAPVPDAAISLVFLTRDPGLPGQALTRQTAEIARIPGTADDQQPRHVSTNTLGTFEIGDLQEGEYRVTIRKDGYEDFEDFVHIPGLLQEKIFALQKVTQ